MEETEGITNYKDVCRLCLASEYRLKSVFEKSEERMQKKVFTTTGVEILPTDFITQMICCNCYDIVFKMWNFRKTAIHNDRFLKKTYFDYSKKSLEERDSTYSKSVPVETNQRVPEVKDKEETILIDDPIPPDSNGDQLISKLIPNKIHPSISKVLNEYPNLKIAASCLRFHVSPHVRLQKDEVASYFIEKNLNYKEHLRMALGEERYPVVLVEETIPPKDSLSVQLKKNFCAIVQSGTVSNSVTDSSEVMVSNNEGDFDNNKRKAQDQPSQESAKKPKDADLEISEELLHHVRKGVPALICNVCNAIHYNKRDLKRHKQKHSRCQFCKLYLNTMERKEEHLKENNCPVKAAMLNINAIKIPLTKMELEKDLMDKYPRVAQRLQFAINRKKKRKPLTVTGIIELSDDDDQQSTTTCSTPDPQKINCNIPALPKTTADTSSTTTTIQNVTVGENVPFNTSLVRPDIIIRDSELLNQYDPKTSDILVVKDLIKKNYKPAVKETQTSFLECCKTDIVKDSTIEFRSLLKQVKSYSAIPVNIKNGPLKVSYERPVEETKKPLIHWNHTRAVRPRNVILKSTKNFIAKNAIASKTTTSAAQPSRTISAPRTATGSTPLSFKCSAPKTVTSSSTSTYSTYTKSSGTVNPTTASKILPGPMFAGNDVSALQPQAGITVNNTGTNVSNRQDSYYLTNNSVINNVLVCKGPDSTAPFKVINLNVPHDPTPIIQMSNPNNIVNNPSINIAWPTQAGYSIQNPNVFHLVPNSNFQLAQVVQQQVQASQSATSAVQSSRNTVTPVISQPTTSTSVTASNNLTIFNNIIVANKEPAGTTQTGDGKTQVAQNLLPKGMIRVKPMWELL